MTKVTVENYKDDKYYPKIVRVVEAILARGDIVAPVDVFVRMELLSKTDVESWRFGRAPLPREGHPLQLGQDQWRPSGKATIEDERPYLLKGNKWKRQFETT